MSLQLNWATEKKNQLVEEFLSNMVLKTHGSVWWIYEESSIFPNLTESIYKQDYFLEVLLPEYVSQFPARERAISGYFKWSD